MTFAEFMAANPSEQAAYDAVIATARAEGDTAARTEMQKIVAKVLPILNSEDYSKAVKACGIKAITGEGTLSAFEAVVVIADQAIEEAKEKAAKGEQGGETAAAGGGDATDTEAAAEFDAKKERLKGGV